MREGVYFKTDEVSYTDAADETEILAEMQRSAKNIKPVAFIRDVNQVDLKFFNGTDFDIVVNPISIQEKIIIARLKRDSNIRLEKVRIQKTGGWSPDKKSVEVNKLLVREGRQIGVGD